MAVNFHGRIIASLLASGEEGLTAGTRMIEEVLPLSTCKATSARVLFCILNGNIFEESATQIRENVLTRLDQLLPTLLRLALDNIATVRTAAVNALKPWCGEEVEVVRVSMA